MTNSVMHVGIENPAQNRKEILSIAIDTIQTLKEFELHKKINKEKVVYRSHFIQVVKDLSKSIQEFKDMLPAVHEHHPKKEEVVKKPEEKPKIVVKKPHIRRSKTELDKLEDDISSLRSKIADL